LADRQWLAQGFGQAAGNQISHAAAKADFFQQILLRFQLVFGERRLHRRGRNLR